MLEAVSIRNLKACKSLDIRLSQLNVLAGLNSSGKSSVLQSLALLRQSYSRPLPSGLTLNGDWASLGTGKDALHEDAESDELSIGITEDSRAYEWVCRCPANAYVLPFIKQPTQVPEFINRPFQYLAADRITPATMYPYAPQHIRDAGELGLGGEYTADFLARNRGLDVREQRRIRGSRAAPTPTLFDQAAAWLQHLSPGVTLDAQELPGTDNVRLAYQYTGRKRNVKSAEFRPTNVGFGLTYVLPIIVSCLVARPGATLLLENPEAHLHPQGQVALGTLLAQAAGDGVQIVVETHSDHVLNGLRLAVKRGTLAATSVAIHYFSRIVETGAVKVQSPVVQSNGRLSFWPEGFFDQWDKSLDELLD